jgi:chromosome segregation ATPase
MNRYYIIVPVVLMGVFIFFERGAAADKARNEQVKIEAQKQEQAKKDAEKKALEEKAKIDSEKRNADRLKGEKEKEDARVAKYQAAVQKLKDDGKKYTDDVDANNKLVTRMEKDLADLREKHDRENREAFDLAKKVEITKKLRRDAELEVQRLNGMLAARANESILTKMPVVATAATAEK